MMAHFIGGTEDGRTYEIPGGAHYIVSVPRPQIGTLEDFTRIELGPDGLPPMRIPAHGRQFYRYVSFDHERHEATYELERVEEVPAKVVYR